MFDDYEDDWGSAPDSNGSGSGGSNPSHSTPSDSDHQPQPHLINIREALSKNGFPPDLIDHLMVSEDLDELMTPNQFMYVMEELMAKMKRHKESNVESPQYVDEEYPDHTRIGDVVNNKNPFTHSQFGDDANALLKQEVLSKSMSRWKKGVKMKRELRAHEEVTQKTKAILKKAKGKQRNSKEAKRIRKMHHESAKKVKKLRRNLDKEEFSGTDSDDDSGRGHGNGGIGGNGGFSVSIKPHHGVHGSGDLMQNGNFLGGHGMGHQMRQIGNGDDGGIFGGNVNAMQNPWAAHFQSNGNSAWNDLGDEDEAKKSKVSAKRRKQMNKARVRRRGRFGNGPPSRSASKKQEQIRRKIAAQNKKDKKAAKKRRQKVRSQLTSDPVKPTMMLPPVLSVVTSERVGIRWKAPLKDGRSPIEEFQIDIQIVTVMMVGDGDVESGPDGQSADRNDSEFVSEWKRVYGGMEMKKFKYTVDGLLPGLRYRFRVRARNRNGVGQWSETAQCTTKGEMIPLDGDGVRNHLSQIKSNKEKERERVRREREREQERKKQKLERKRLRRDQELAQRIRKQLN